MMFRPVILAVAASLLAAPALAADAPVWVGGFLVTALVGADCATKASVIVGDLYTVILHPKFSALDTSVPTDVIQIIRSGPRAHRIVPKSPATHFLPGNGNYIATSWSARAVQKSYSATYSNVAINLTSPSQQFVEMSGTLNKIDNVLCDLTFSAALTLKP